MTQTVVAREIERRRKLLGKTPRGLSLEAGLKPNYVRDILIGQSRNPAPEKLAKIAAVLGCTLDDLVGNAKGPLAGERSTAVAAPISDHLAAYNGGLQPGVIEIGRAEFVSIGRFDASFSAGPGSLIDPQAEPLDFHLVSMHWLRALTTAAPEQLAIVKVSNDSMTPTLNDGDWVLIDRAQRRASREGIYALRVFDDSWIKRISLNFRDRLVQVISDNPLYPMKELPEDEIDLIGRVISLVSRRMP
jgi:phage repressor protein C with HTH and peptisase S24 domain